MNINQLILSIPLLALGCSATETGIGVAMPSEGPTGPSDEENVGKPPVNRGPPMPAAGTPALTCEYIICLSSEDVGALDIAIGTWLDSEGALRVDRFLLESGDFPIGHQLESLEGSRELGTQSLVYVRHADSGGISLEHELAIQGDRALCGDLSIALDAWLDLATAPDCEKQVQDMREASSAGAE